MYTFNQTRIDPVLGQNRFVLLSLDLDYGNGAHDVIHVTLDYVLRGFRIGFSTVGPMRPAMAYEGRGWKDRLFEDAKAYLLKEAGIIE